MKNISILLSITLVVIFSCSRPSSEIGLNTHTTNELVPPTINKSQPFPSKQDSLLSTYGTILQSHPELLSDGFDYPVGPPDGNGYYDAQPFGTVNSSFAGNLHLGEDWNGIQGGNSDLGDPVYSISPGIVYEAGFAGPGWGQVAIITHPYVQNDSLKYIQALYGHLQNMSIEPGDFVKKNEKLGEMDNLNGAIYAHCHFELRTDISMSVGGGYSLDTTRHISPKAFIASHRSIPK